MSLAAIVVGVVLFILIGLVVGWSQGGNCGEMIVSFIVVGMIMLCGGSSVYRLFQMRKASNQMTAFTDALDRFHQDCGRYPTSAEGLAALIQKPAGCDTWKAYLDLDALPQDPWDRDYTYSLTGKGSFQITSAGPKEDETSDDITVSRPLPAEPQ
jgi:general secretion pathway protein G